MKKFLTSFLLLISFLAIGQKQWELGVSVGASNYQGDVVKPSLFTLKETNPAFGISLSRHFNSHWALRGNAFYGKLSGDDVNFTDRVSRGYSFSTPITEFSLIAQYDVFGNRRMRDGAFHKGISPYFFIGGGVGLINPTTKYNETGNAYNIANINKDKAEGFKKANFVLPVGAGFKYSITQRTTLGLEMGIRPDFTDKIDQISNSGNPKKDDWYVIGGLTLGFRLGKLDAPKMVEKVVIDTDGDGIADIDDNCPTVKGVVSNKGCPVVTVIDTDGDGIADADDKCPTVKGVASNKGCPVVIDTDGDGIADIDDNCPTVKGVASNKGCPVVIDTDGDGIADADDKCPTLAGVASNNGCPAVKDSDGDGIEDSADKCPTVKGVPSNNGCPAVSVEPVVTKEEAETLKFAINNINFETSKSILTKESYTTMDKIVTILKKYPTYKMTISGHTDGDGDDASNMRLSDSRANACMKYFVSKGIEASRLTAKGYGETTPVASNSTAEGKRQNRRVEFKLMN